MWDWLSKLAELRNLNTPCVLLTITSCNGSTPREPGTKMIVLEDGRFFGTIGGGHLESLAIADALKSLTGDVSQTIRYPLGAKTGQCCGGTVDILYEVQNGGPELYVFGAGHVGQAIARVLVGTPFRVHVIDDRPEWIESENLPAMTMKHACEWDEFVSEARFDAAKTYVAIMTFRHDMDQDILEKLLKVPMKYLGLIGSKSKWERFKQRLTARGVSAEELARVHCPIGIPTGKAPQEVAISFAAELLRIHYT